MTIIIIIIIITSRIITIINIIITIITIIRMFSHDKTLKFMTASITFDIFFEKSPIRRKTCEVVSSRNY